MFDKELETGITDSLVSLDERVGELERKEGLTVLDGIGPFRYEVHVDWAGRGGFTSIKAACDYVAVQSNVGVDEWVIWVHAGSYVETAFVVPEFVTIEGLGGDVFITTSSFFLPSSLITAGDFVTLRNLRATQALSSDTQAAFIVDAGQSLKLENCKFAARFQGAGSGDVHPTGCVRVTGGGANFLDCELLATNQTDAQWFVVYIDAFGASDPSYIRGCRIWLDPAGAYLINGTSIRFDGNGEKLYLLETTILPRTSVDPGFDLMAGTGATIYLRATNYIKGDGTITYMYTAGAGSVTSVNVAVPDILTSTGGPITTSGTITIGLANQDANLVFAGPASGIAAAPDFRALVVDDIPTLPPSKISGNVVTGTSVANRIAVWDDTDSISGDPNFTYNFTDNYLTQAGRTYLGGVTSATGAGAGYVTDAFVELGSDQGAGDTRHASILLMSALQTSVNQIFSGIVWANRSITPATEKRIAQIVAYTDSTIDRGTLRVMMAPGSDADPVEVMRFNPERAIWIGDPDSYSFSLTGAGDLEVEGDLQVGGSIIATFSTLQTGMIAGNTLTLRAYDVDGAAYTTFATLTANNTPTMDLADSVTKAGGYIYRAGGTSVPVTDGGTGASTAAGARTNLGAIGGSGSANQVMYWSAADTASGDAGLTYDASTDALTIAGLLTVRTSALHVTTGDRVGIRTLIPQQPLDVVGTMQSRQYGSAPSIRVSRGNTSEASPSRVLSGETIGQIALLGFEDGTNTFSAGADFVGVATADFTTASNNPTELRIRVNTGSGLVTRVTVGGSNATVAITGTLWAEETTGGLFTIARNDTGVAINDSIGKINFWGNDTQLSTQNFFGNIEVQAQANIGTDAAFGKMLLRTTGNGAAASPVERLALGLVKNLTDAATNLFEVTLNAGEMAGGTIVWTIIASNGTDHQAYSGIATYAVVNKAGTYTSQVTHDAANDSKAVSSGTLTAAWTVLNGTNKVTIRVTPTGSLTETIYQILYSVHSNSPQTITIL